MASSKKRVSIKRVSPKRILHRTAEYAWMMAMLDSCPRPVGYYINRLSQKEKDILKELKSDDIKNQGFTRYEKR